MIAIKKTEAGMLRDLKLGGPEAGKPGG